MYLLKHQLSCHEGAWERGLFSTFSYITSITKINHFRSSHSTTLKKKTKMLDCLYIEAPLNLSLDDVCHKFLTFSPLNDKINVTTAYTNIIKFFTTAMHMWFWLIHFLKQEV
jgi:hypothetical protein